MPRKKRPKSRSLGEGALIAVERFGDPKAWPELARALADHFANLSSFFLLLSSLPLEQAKGVVARKLDELAAEEAEEAARRGKKR